MKEDKLPSGRIMEGDLKELLHFSANVHLLPLLPSHPPSAPFSSHHSSSSSSSWFSPGWPTTLSKETLASKCRQHTSSELLQRLNSLLGREEVVPPPCSSFNPHSG